MNQNDKRKLENELMVLGLAGLDDPELIEQLAQLVSAWPGDKHDYFMSLLNECEPDKRTAMYESMAPKLRFKALSLAQYETQIALKAGALISQGRMRVEGSTPPPIVIGNDKYAEVPRAQASACVVTVTCYHCRNSEKFLGDTPAGAMMAARKAGWVRDPGLNKEVCAECIVKPKPFGEVAFPLTVDA